MPEQMTTYVLQWQEDAGSRRKAEKGIQSVVDESKGLSKAQSQVVSTAQKASKELEGIGKRATRIQSIARAFQEAANAGDNTFQAAEKAARALDRLGASESEITKVKQELGLAADQAKQLDTALSAVAANEQFSFTSSRVALAGDVQSNLGAVRGLASTAGLGGIGQGIGIAGEFAVLSEEIPRLKVALKGMPEVLRAAAQEIGKGGLAAGAGLIAAVAALAVVSALAAKAQKELETRIKSRLDTELELAAFLATATSEEIKERLDAANATQKQLEAEQALAKERTKQFDEIQNFLKESGLGGVAPGLATDILTSGKTSSLFALGGELPIIGEFSEGIAETLTEARLASDALDENSIALANNAVEIDTLTDSLGSGSIEAQRMAEREKELADIRRDQATSNAIAFIEEQVQARFEANKLLKEGNKEALDNEVATLEEELAKKEELNDDLKNLYVNSYGLAKDAIKAEIDANDIRIYQLRDTLIPIYQDAANSTAIFANGIKDIGNELDQAVPAFSKFSDALREAQTVSVAQVKLNNELESISQKGADKIAAIRSNLADKEADLLRNLGRSIADARTKANQAVQDLDRKQSADLLKIEEDYARQRAKIVRDANRDINAAISDRDVLAFTQAKQTRDEQLDDAKQGYDEQRQELQRSYQQQLQDISINLQRQEQEIRLQYNRQLQDVQQAAQARIQLEQQRISAELRLRQAGYNAMLQSEQAFVQAQINLFQGLATAGGNILNSLGSAVSQATASAGGGAVNTALNLAGGGGVNVLAGTGGNTNNVNMTNNFPQGVNTNQIVTTVLGQINNLIGN